MSDSEFTTVCTKRYNKRCDKLVKSNDDEDIDESVEKLVNQTIIEKNIKDLYYDLTNYSKEKILSIGEKMNEAYLLSFIYPNLKSLL
jgi:hypothetical protein